jgi:hypothetical protein
LKSHSEKWELTYYDRNRIGHADAVRIFKSILKALDRS